MMEYQKLLNKESREDKKITDAEKESKLGAKGTKLDAATKQIEVNKREASQKADALQTAAQTSMATGVVSSAGSTTGAASAKAGPKPVAAGRTPCTAINPC